MGMYERDYDGDMGYYQKQLLKKKGMTKRHLDMSQYCGLTARELQNIVDSVYFTKPVLCRCEKCGAAVLSERDYEVIDGRKHCLECGDIINLPEEVKN